MRHKVEPVWRPAVEGYAAGAWLTAAALLYVIGQGGGQMGLYLKALCFGALAAAATRLFQVLALWERKAQLTQQRDLQFTTKALFKRLERAEKRARKGRLKIEEQ